MQTITFFATKGGTGRTVSTMALASGFLAMGKRVLVRDCTDEAKADPRRDTPTTLQRWRKAMSSSGVLEDRLQLLSCTTREDIEDMLASADTDGFDIALIDTRILPQEPQGAALGRADLILSPAIGEFEAKNVVKGISEYLVEPDNVLGLIPGCRAGAADIPATRAAFASIPILKTELPWSEAIGDQVVNGDIGHFTECLACEQFGTGYGRFREAQAAWSAVLALTVEVQWALDGLQLQPHVSEWKQFVTKQKASA
ncbi:MAG: hypothetical protein ABJH45_10710 [Paracoccaceae bacterium]